MKNLILNLRTSALIFVLPLLLLNGCSQSSQSQDGQTRTISPSAGQEVFLNNCVTCHMGDGDPPRPNSVITRSSKLLTEKEFINYVRNPDNNMMPAFSSGQISDEHLVLLYSYLRKETHH